MLVAVPLIGTTIEPMTATLFTPYNTPICKDITTAFPNPPGTDPPDLCFTISVVPSTGYFSVGHRDPQTPLGRSAARASLTCSRLSSVNRSPPPPCVCFITSKASSKKRSAFGDTLAHAHAHVHVHVHGMCV